MSLPIQLMGRPRVRSVVEVRRYRLTGAALSLILGQALMRLTRWLKRTAWPTRLASR
jgi:hypothetical protein